MLWKLLWRMVATVNVSSNVILQENSENSGTINIPVDNRLAVDDNVIFTNREVQGKDVTAWSAATVDGVINNSSTLGYR